MNVYQFEWKIFATFRLVSDLKRLANAGSAVSRGEIEELLAIIFEKVGGLPVCYKRYSATERTVMGKQLLLEALQSYLAAARPNEAPGYYADDINATMLEKELRSMPKIAINSAGLAALDQLPGIGSVLAAKIIRERTTNGPFHNLQELDERVDGVGEQMIREWEHLVTFDPVPTPYQNYPVYSGNFDLDFAAFFFWMPPASRDEKLLEGLQRLAMYCAGNPHPFTVKGIIREWDFATPPPAPVAADWSGVLFGGSYFFQLQEMLKNATQSIDVCMFHIALPEPVHPTRLLLNALVTAAQNGLAVRVLMDQDLPEDPYKSTVINANARAFLEQNNIPVKYDTTDQLLHSKFVLIDDRLCVIGSHNWSAGSYFQFDDLSVVIHSAAFLQTMRQRFDALWNAV